MRAQDGSGAASDALAGERCSQPEAWTEHRRRYPDTKAIAGALFMPQGAGPFPAVIYLGYCASFDSGDERAVQKTLVERLTFAGVVSYWPWCGWGADFPVPTLVLIGEKDDWSSPGVCKAIKDKPNLEVVVLPGATNSFALPGVSDHLGHHTVYDEKATQDAQARTEAFLAAHAK